MGRYSSGVRSAGPEDRVSNCRGLPQTKALLRMWGFHCKHQESPKKTRMSVLTTGKLFKKYWCPPPTQERHLASVGEERGPLSLRHLGQEDQHLLTLSRPLAVCQ